MYLMPLTPKVSVRRWPVDEEVVHRRSYAKVPEFVPLTRAEGPVPLKRRPRQPGLRRRISGNTRIFLPTVAQAARGIGGIAPSAI